MFLASNKKSIHPEIPADALEALMQEKELLNLIPWEIAKEFGAFVTHKSPDIVHIAALDPDNAALRAYARERFGDKISWFLAHQRHLNEVLERQNRDYAGELARLVQADMNA